VTILRRLPAERPVKENMQGPRGDPFLGPEDMGYFHQMVIDNIGQVIGGKSIAFHDHRIGADVLVFTLHLAHYQVPEFGLSLQGDFKADHIGFSPIDPPLGLRGIQIPAVAIVSEIFAFGFLLLFPNLVQALCSTKTGIGVPLLYQLITVFCIKITSLRLDIGSEVSTLIGTFVPLDSQPFKSIIKILEGLLAESLLIGIFHPEDKRPPLGAGIEIVE